MTKVKLLISRCGTGFTQPGGSVVEVDDDEAERLFASRQAVPAKGEPLSVLAGGPAAPGPDETTGAKGETKSPAGETGTPAPAGKKERKKKG